MYTTFLSNFILIPGESLVPLFPASDRSVVKYIDSLTHACHFYFLSMYLFIYFVGDTKNALKNYFPCLTESMAYVSQLRRPVVSCVVIEQLRISQARLMMCFCLLGVRSFLLCT